MAAVSVYPAGENHNFTGRPRRGKNHTGAANHRSADNRQACVGGSAANGAGQCHLSDGRGRLIRYHQAAACSSGRRLCEGDGIDDSDKVLTLEDDRLEQAIEQTGARLVVLDPIQGYIGASVDMHRANEIRPLMYRIAKLAEKYGCAILLIGHMNKNSGEKSSYRGLGSIDFQAAARSVLVVGRIKDDPTLRVVCPAKSSLAPEGGAVAFRLDPEQGFQWAGPYDISVDELLSGSSRGHKLREAQSFLKEVLADGPLPQTEIEAAAQQAGIRPKTLRNARYELGVTSTKISKQWLWALPEA